MHSLIAQKCLLEMLGFVKRFDRNELMSLIVPEDSLPDGITEDELCLALQHAQPASFIEQHSLSWPFSSGGGVSARLPDTSSWSREIDLSPDERVLLIRAGFINKSVFVQSVLATKH